MSKKRIIGFLKKQWILVWLIMASSLLMTTVVFAAYKDTNKKLKRVIAPTAKIVDLFTSNYLETGVSGNHRTAYFSANDDNTYTFDVDIRNYDPSDPGTVYNGVIDYTLSASAVDGTGASVTLGSEQSIVLVCGNNTITLDSNSNTGSRSDLSLTNIGAIASDKDSWQITFTGIPLESNIFLRMVATPSTQGVKTISADIGISPMAAIVSVGWEGHISDNTADDITKYDAFNYTIAGTGNKTLKFSYNRNYLEINPVFLEYYDITDQNITHESSGWVTITINADSDVVNRYDFQLYKVNSASFESFESLENRYTNFQQS